jgi:hypothetical protein
MHALLVATLYAEGDVSPAITAHLKIAPWSRKGIYGYFRRITTVIRAGS